MTCIPLSTTTVATTTVATTTVVCAPGTSGAECSSAASSSDVSLAGAIAGSVVGVACIALLLFVVFKYWQRKSSITNNAALLRFGNFDVEAPSEGAPQIVNPTHHVGTGATEPKTMSLGMPTAVEHVRAN